MEIRLVLERKLLPLKLTATEPAKCEKRKILRFLNQVRGIVVMTTAVKTLTGKHRAANVATKR